MRAHFLLVAALLPVAAQAADPVPPITLGRGALLVYRGTLTEEGFPSSAGRREFDATFRVLVTAADAESLTLAVWSEFAPRDRGRPAARVEVRRIDRRGRALALPAGELPVWPQTPLDRLPLGEAGMFPPRPADDAETWHHVEPDRPRLSFRAGEPDTFCGVRCVEVSASQESPGEAGRAAPWTRAETTHLHGRDGFAMAVKRQVGFADPVTREPSFRSTLDYALDARREVRGPTLDEWAACWNLLARRCAEVESLTVSGAADASTWGRVGQAIAATGRDLPAGLTGASELLDGLLAKVEAGKGGKLPPVPPTRERSAVGGKGLAVGRAWPDFAADDCSGTQKFNRKGFLGVPTLAVYYRVDSGKAESLLKFAEAMRAANPSKLRVAAFALGDAAQAWRQQQRWGLNFPVLAGGDVMAAHGVESTPTMALIDGEGQIRHVLIGWDAQGAELAAEELVRALRGRAGPAGKP